MDLAESLAQGAGSRTSAGASFGVEPSCRCERRAIPSEPSSSVTECLQFAAAWEKKAAEATDPGARYHCLFIAAQWRCLAEAYEFLAADDLSLRGREPDIVLH
jgi:hypothetical protein